jgi:serine/threonine-protein kinase
MIGGTLRDRLTREKQLAIDEVVALGAKIARALQFAHDRNVLHRDVKPENILFSDNECCLADFGIARALSRSSDEWTTSTGIVRGTPAYMSPEQAAGERDTDARSDIYSLACVLYEALAGIAAFVGPTQASVVAQRLTRVPPGVRVYRATVPEGLERVLERALALSPVDRFQSAAEFAAALETAHEYQPQSSVATTGHTSPVWRRRRTTVAALTIAAAAATWLIARPFVFPTRPTDPNLYAVFAVDGTVDAQNEAAQRLRESLRAWTGIRVVDQLTQQSSLGVVARAGVMSGAAVRDAARKLGSGRYVRVIAKPDGDSVGVTATLFDVDSAQLMETSARVAPKLVGADSAFARLAERLLFHDTQLDPSTEPRIGTRSVPARRAYLSAHVRVREWDLRAADSAFFRADSLDPSYSEASLWLALVRFWRNESSNRWRDFAERASRGTLASSEQPLAAALLAFAAGTTTSACENFENLASSKRDDGLLWYSAGKCRWLDNAVLADHSSPSGWRFRSSYRLALSHYERALQFSPVIYREMRRDGFDQLRKLLKTSGNDLRAGRALPPSTEQFVAYPTLSNDTLALFPIPMADVVRQTESARQFFPEIPAAVRRQREVLRDWTITWSSNYPQSAEAWEAVAVALESLGDASSLDTIARARAFARTERERSRVRGTEAWLRVKFSLPADLRGIHAARLLTDSVLAEPKMAMYEPKLIASLAALTGRLEMAKRYAASIPDWPRSDAPAELNSSTARLLVHSAMGGSLAELQALERNVDSLAGLSMPRPGRADSLLGPTRSEASRALARLFLARAAVLSYPTQSGSVYSDTAAIRYPLFETFRAWLRADTAFVLKQILGWREARRSIPAGDVQVDALLPETLLMIAAVGPSDAVQWMDPTLAALRFSSQMNFLDPIRAAALVRAMALRADLANQLGDHATAAVWARAVAELWENCDPDLRPVRDRMRRLTRQTAG